MQSNSHLTQNDKALRHLCNTSLAGTEGHLHGVNKGNPALHHHDYWHKNKNKPSDHPECLECYETWSYIEKIVIFCCEPGLYLPDNKQELVN